MASDLEGENLNSASAIILTGVNILYSRIVSSLAAEELASSIENHTRELSTMIGEDEVKSDGESDDEEAPLVRNYGAIT